MTFAHPQILWLLLVFPPALVAFFWWSSLKRKELMAQFIQSRLLPGLISGVSPARQRLRNACLVLSTIFIILALARPQWGFDWEEVKQRGLDIVVAIDSSKSMLAEDIAPNRLGRAKLAAMELMQLAKSDRLGLVAFAGSAFLTCPLTIDDTAFAQSVSALDVNTISQGGTALADAIETAQTAFKEGDNHRILVLMTDGEDHDSGAVEAAKKAVQAGLQIFTIGIGTAEGELLRIKDANGQPNYIRDEQGNVVKSHLNEALLQEIAGASEKGFYLPLRGAKTMEILFEKGLAPLPKSESSEKLVKRLKERYYWPLALGIVLLLVEMLFPERKRERRTQMETQSARTRPLATVGCMLALMLLSSGRAAASPSSALRDYKAGDYDRALQEYQKMLGRKKDDPRLHFNAGTAAYRDQKFDDAIKQFDEALASQDLNLQSLAYYNRGNSQFWQGQREPDPEKKKGAWEKSLQDFESSMKLNPKDTDAKYNHEFVKKMLEELKKQQQQQQKNQQNKNDQQNQQDQQQQNQQQDQQSKQDQNQQQQQQQNQSQQKQDNGQQQQQRQQQAQQKDQQEKQKEQQQQQAQAEKKKQEEQKAQASQGEKTDKGDEKNQEQAYAAGQMTPEQAERLMDAQKGEEQMLQLKPENKPQDNGRPFKDW
jgi:Ca-activated chloride channel family protein